MSAEAFILPRTPEQVLDPTAYSPQVATRMGVYLYQHGTSYNGGNAPTITVDAGDGTLSSVQLGDFYPYIDKNGNWRLRFNIDITVNSNSRSQMTTYINGISFPSSPTQSISGSSNANVALNRMQANNNTNSIIVRHDLTTTVNYRYSGDVILVSKPTWAY